MFWQGIQVGLTTLTFWLSGARPPHVPSSARLRPELSFQQVRTDGGAALGSPFVLPPELAPSTLPRPRTLPREIPAKSTVMPTPPRTIPSTISKTSVNLATLWRIAKKHHPALRVESTHPSEAAQRTEGIARIRRGYFEYLGLVQEGYAVESALRRLDEKIAEQRTRFDTDRLAAKADLLGLESLREEMETQRRRTLANLESTWGVLAVDVGLPAMPAPTAIHDHAHSPPKWQWAEIERRVRQSSALRSAMAQVHAAQSNLTAVRIDVVPSLAAPRDFGDESKASQLPLSFWQRKQARIRAAESTHARAVQSMQLLELNLLGQAKDAWARYGAAYDNLKRLNAESLPRLRSLTELVRQVQATNEDSAAGRDICHSERELFRALVEQCRTRRDLWRAATDLQTLMDVGIDDAIPQ